MSKLNVEYKRRFLVSELPIGFDLNSLVKTEMMLGYLSKPADSLDIECECLENDIYNLNMRDIGTNKRNKIVISLTQDDANLIMSLSNPKILNIDQYEINKNLYLNIVTNMNNFMFVDYISTEEDLVKFEPYFWFKKEITNDYHYSNLNLAITKRI